MKNIIVLGLGTALTLSIAACSDKDETTDGGTNTDGGSVADAGTNAPPAAPTLGGLIDRMGRPGVNTAVTDPFDSNAAAEDTQKDRYNVAEQTAWVTSYKTQFAGNLAVYDGLDRNCGNQFAAAAAPGAGRYDALAGVLADDQLYVNTAVSTCDVYLGVEANATGIIPNQDCGGRTPQYDVIDVTYSVFAIGAVSGVTDGIANDSTFLPNFPFLGTPN